ncbi:MAG: sel1 repeat family protein [Alphaproteobacteria bacterium]|nr:MAG: sel1 repeat family protein [Alphaproteobacteria bacterium]
MKNFRPKLVSIWIAAGFCLAAGVVMAVAGVFNFHSLYSRGDETAAQGGSPAWPQFHRDYCTAWVERRISSPAVPATLWSSNAVERFRTTQEQEAKESNPALQRQLGIFYLYGSGAKKSYSEALKWLKKSASGGDAAAQALLGSVYKGTYDHDKVVMADLPEAYFWSGLASMQGFTEADRHCAEARDRLSAAQRRDVENRILDWLKNHDVPAAERE